jgi:signal transduction histidine kinase
MQTEHFIKHRVARWGLYLGFWTSLGVFNVCQAYLLASTTHRPFNWSETLLFGLIDWYLWVVLAPCVVALARRFRFEQETWRRSLAWHVSLSLAVGLLVALAVTDAMYLCNIGSVQSRPFERTLLWVILSPYLVLYVWVYWAIILVDHAWGYYRKYRERELQASQLATQLARAQLHTLKMQLQPHFLFNTLQTVSALMHKDVELADDMLARLADLLRSTLDTAQSQEVPLRRELEFIATYLEIEQARLGSRLDASLESEPDVWDALVPNLILQPLVENAVRHGVAPRPEGGRLVVRARRVPAGLEIRVEDDGPGLPTDHCHRAREGVGLANTRARLAALYGPDHEFTLESGPHSGTHAVLRLPFREQAEETAVAVVAHA